MNFNESHSKDLINTSNLEIREYVFTCPTPASKKILKRSLGRIRPIEYQDSFTYIFDNIDWALAVCQALF